MNTIPNHYEIAKLLLKTNGVCGDIEINGKRDNFSCDLCPFTHINCSGNKKIILAQQLITEVDEQIAKLNWLEKLK